MSAPEKVVIGNAELWHGDCREVLPLLPKHDLLLTDPPYGIGESSKKVESRQRGGKLGTLLGYSGKAMADQKDYGEFDWDRHARCMQVAGNIRRQLLRLACVVMLACLGQIERRQRLRGL
jgi:DNA modification methylase